MRDRFSNLNLSRELGGCGDVDHKLMDKMIDIPEAVVSMEGSELSLGVEEQYMCNACAC